MVSQKAVEFKGTKEGLLIKIRENQDFMVVKDSLIKQIDKAGEFFKGAKILDIECPDIEDEKKEELKSIVQNHFKLSFVEKEERIEIDRPFEGIKEGMTKFHHGTLRSGQQVSYQGNIVVFGDVNPGAVVTAYGNIVVFGSLRGIAHAGANGNKDATVTAIHLNPTQLRIANLIARAPDEKQSNKNTMEIAGVKRDMVYIESINHKGKKKGEK